jgi:hypothetical protein
MSGSLFKISTFTEPTASRAEKEDLPLQLEKAFLIIMQTYHPLFQEKRQGSAFLLETAKSCLQLFTNLRAVPRVMLKSLSSYTLDVSLYWQVM